MKTYQVIFDVEALADAQTAAAFIATTAPLNAARWYAKLTKAISTLATFPKRCPKAPEAATLNMDLRQLIFCNYRIIFIVDDDTVHIVHIRHAARLPLGQDPPDDD